jgi:hypothetical protein
MKLITRVLALFGYETMLALSFGTSLAMFMSVDMWKGAIVSAVSALIPVISALLKAYWVDGKLTPEEIDEILRGDSHGE